MNQLDMLELIRQHPDRSIAELADMMNPGSRQDRERMRQVMLNKMKGLKKYGLVERVVYGPGNKVRWRVKE